MEDPMKVLLDGALKISEWESKALAGFLFREVIEDAHVKYNISQEDMKVMCKDAVNRAAMFLKIKGTDLYRAFAIHALEGFEWDDPEETDFLKETIELLRSVTE